MPMQQSNTQMLVSHLNDSLSPNHHNSSVVLPKKQDSKHLREAITTLVEEDKSQTQSNEIDDLDEQNF